MFRFANFFSQCCMCNFFLCPFGYLQNFFYKLFHYPPPPSHPPTTATGPSLTENVWLLAINDYATQLFCMFLKAILFSKTEHKKLQMFVITKFGKAFLGSQFNSSVSSGSFFQRQNVDSDVRKDSAMHSSGTKFKHFSTEGVARTQPPKSSANSIPTTLPKINRNLLFSISLQDYIFYSFINTLQKCFRGRVSSL